MYPTYSAVSNVYWTIHKIVNSFYQQYFYSVWLLNTPHHTVLDAISTFNTETTWKAPQIRKVSANLTYLNFTFFCARFVVPGFCVKWYPSFQMKAVKKQNIYTILTCVSCTARYNTDAKSLVWKSFHKSIIK